MPAGVIQTFEMQNSKCKMQNGFDTPERILSFCILHFAFCITAAAAA
jgi:hypothetical protein